MESSSSSSSPAVTAVLAAATTVALTGLSLWWTANNSDFVIRQLLSPKEVVKKRQRQYKSIWEKICTEALQEELLKANTIKNVDDDAQIRQFLSTEFSKTASSVVSIVGIGSSSNSNSSDESGECFVWLRIESSDDDNTLVRFPLKRFGLLLADHMSLQLTSTAMVFVSDASAGLGTEIISSILKEQPGSLGVPVLEEPIWMAQFAALVVEPRNVILQHDALTKVLFGLVRLEAFRVRTMLGRSRTVAFTLGQSMVASLAPLLQACFPCDRHVFIYDGAVSSVARAVVKRKALGARQQQDCWRDRYRCAQLATPLSLDLSNTKRSLPKALAELPVHLADATETWMTSVDAFLRLKEEEKTNEYLPFVSKLGLLIVLGTAEDRELALINLLQFLTGSRSRGLPGGVLSQAQQSLMKVGMRQLQLSPFRAVVYKQIEGCVFCHRGILIGDKTLTDTVKPAVEWTLKAARKISGCMCCAPGEDDDDEEGEEEEVGVTRGLKDDDKRKQAPLFVNGIDMSQPGAFALVFNSTRTT